MENTNTPEQESSQSQAPSNNSNRVINQEALPNSTLILVLGISSIVLTFCCCFGGSFFPMIGPIVSIIGLVIGIILTLISLFMAKKAKHTYKQNPELYTESSYKNIIAGRICAIIGLSLAGLCLLIMIIGTVLFGALFFANSGINNF